MSLVAEAIGILQGLSPEDRRLLMEGRFPIDVGDDVRDLFAEIFADGSVGMQVRNALRANKESTSGHFEPVNLNCATPKDWTTETKLYQWLAPWRRLDFSLRIGNGASSNSIIRVYLFPEHVPSDHKGLEGNVENRLIWEFCRSGGSYPTETNVPHVGFPLPFAYGGMITGFNSLQAGQPEIFEFHGMLTGEGS
jgi:hypothetical protein